LAVRASGKGLGLACVFAPDVPDEVIGDPCRLRKILINLIGNAIKFTEQGEVVVELRNKESHAKAQRHKEEEVASSSFGVLASLREILLQFEVRDTGIGIPPDRQAHIFEAFAQADGSTTRKYGGTGLGLTICKRLAELMGGRIAVRSEVGKGSTFSVQVCLRLPGPSEKRPAPKPVAPQVAPPAALSRPLRVLLAEDNVVNQRLAVRMLEKRGHAVAVAADGPGAGGPGARALRPGADGPANAGDERLRGHGRHPPAGRGDRPPRARHRPHRERDGRRPRAVPPLGL
jgi:hypothetical protein